MTMASLRTWLGRGLLGVTSASLLLTTSLPPAVGQWAPPGMARGPADQPAGDAYGAEELEAILAPVALYPDALLTQVLMAASFPDDVASAAGWARRNRGLRGDAMDRALRPYPWDPAVKSLVPFPQALELLAAQPQWMAQLAFAMAVQQPAAFDSIQHLRRRAWLAGTLRSTSQQLVRMDGELIIIEPRQAGIVYVPVYNPAVIYGAWPYPAHPPYYFPPSYALPGGVLATGIYFGLGVVVIGALWGWATPRWTDRYVHVDRNRFEYFRNFHNMPPGGPDRWGQDRWHPPERSDKVRPAPPPQRPRIDQPLPTPPRATPPRPTPPRQGDARPSPAPQHPAPEQPRANPPRGGIAQPGPGPQRQGTEQWRPAPDRGGRPARPAQPPQIERDKDRR